MWLRDEGVRDYDEDWKWVFQMRHEVQLEGV